jgi:hypothetical protein
MGTVLGNAIGIPFGNSSSRAWTQRYITSAYFYELWKVTGAGSMVGLKRGDTLTITGSGLNAIYAVPDTAPYKARDTDYVFHKSNGDVSTACDGNRLIACDFAKIIVKYLDISPYTIDYIGVIDTGQSVTNQMRDDFHLSRWWDNTLSLYGYAKGNRAAEQSVWNPEVTAVVPTVTTTSITAIGQTIATSGGNVTADGGASVTTRGVCWSLSANPTIADSKTTNSSGTGVFTSSITGLTGNTVYHVRAYATNAAGTGYGADIQFTSQQYNILDTFTGTNGAKLNAHTMDIGAGWTASDFFLISTNKLVCSPNVANASYYAIIENGNANGDIRVDVSMASIASYCMGIVFRYQDDSHRWILVMERDGSGTPYLVLKEDGTSRGTVNITQEIITDVLRVNLVGNQIDCYWKDMVTPKLSYTSASYNDKTKMGIYTYCGQSGYVMPTLDNFKIS